MKQNLGDLQLPPVWWSPKESKHHRFSTCMSSLSKFSDLQFQFLSTREQTHSYWIFGCTGNFLFQRRRRFYALYPPWRPAPSLEPKSMWRGPLLHSFKSKCELWVWFSIKVFWRACVYTPHSWKIKGILADTQGRRVFQGPCAVVWILPVWSISEFSSTPSWEEGTCERWKGRMQIRWWTEVVTEILATASSRELRCNCQRTQKKSY